MFAFYRLISNSLFISASTLLSIEPDASIHAITACSLITESG